MKHLRVLAIAAAAMLAGSTLASAQEAFTTNDVNMRAGPGTRYPVVTTIPSDREVVIHGCLSNWDWCDVTWRRNRGWVFSDYLEALYRSRRIGFDEYRTYIDIPFVSFSFGYWDRYYRDRPWFDDWDRWGDGGDRPRWRDRDRNRGDRDRDRDWSGDRDRDRDRVGDRDRDDDGDRNRDRTGDRDREWERTGDRNRADNDNEDNDERTTPRNRRQVREDEDRPGMRCGTEDADPSCPDASRGRRMQMQQQQ